MRLRPSFRPPKFSPYASPSGKGPSGLAGTKKLVDLESDTKTSSATVANNGPKTNTNGTSTPLSTNNPADAQAAATAAAQRDGIPAELMQPLHCKLCDAKLNGSLQATAHYVGKSHAKKVKQYLHSQGRTVGQRVPGTSSNGPQGAGTAADTTKSVVESKRSPTDTLEKFCKLCDVAFTSEIQAKQHYDGRNHQRRLRGEPPLPKGFYNPATGRWQRQPPPGMAMKPATQLRKSMSLASGSSPFFCEPCHTSLTSEQQLNSHLQGAKHKARVCSLASAVTATVVTAGSGSQASTGQREPFIALVAGPALASPSVRISACGTC